MSWLSTRRPESLESHETLLTVIWTNWKRCMVHLQFHIYLLFICVTVITLISSERRWWFFIFRRPTHTIRSRSSLCWYWYDFKHPAFWLSLPRKPPTHTRYVCTCKYGTLLVAINFQISTLTVPKCLYCLNLIPTQDKSSKTSDQITSMSNGVISHVSHHVMVLAKVWNKASVLHPQSDVSRR